MDVATLANFLLFLGAFGASLAFGEEDTTETDNTADDNDALYDSADYARTDRLGDGDDSATADADNLAWFMEGGDDSLTGSSAKDFADLGSGDDTAAMAAGNDIVRAGAGNDSVSGGNGNDLAYGGDGADNLFGDLGDDSLSGDAGDDWLAGGSGVDFLAGGDGNDVISGFSTLGGATASMTAADGADQLSGGAGDDRLIMGRGDAATGGAGADRFEMDARWNDGTGTFTIKDYTAGSDSILLSYAPTFDPNTSLAVPPAVTVQASADGQSSIILLNGTAIATVEGVTDLTAADILLQPDTTTDTAYQPEDFDNTLPGTAGADSATGTAGDDYGRFGDGADSALGGDGADSLLGEGGADTLSGDAGADTLSGGDGNDALSGGAGNDLLGGDLGDDALSGGAGADRLIGGGGNDTLSGFDADGAGGTDAATDGADSLSGGVGDDTLMLGRGDLGIGGTGADTFALDAANPDATAIITVQDYIRATDRIEVHYPRVLNGQGTEIPPTVAILMGPNNAYAVIMFNGDPLAHITGATTLTLADITLIPEA